MPELPWEKWYPTNWASEPGLRLCEVSTRGIWFEAINTMMLQKSGSISGTLEHLSLLCACRPAQMDLAINQLRDFKIADISEQNGIIILSCRKRVRDCYISEIRSRAGQSPKSKTQTSMRPHVETKGEQASASASAYASASTPEGGLGETKISELPESIRTARVCNKWLVWQNVRRGMKKPKSWITLFNEQVEWLGQFDEPTAFEILSSSIRNGWQGLFEPKQTYGKNGKNSGTNSRNDGVCRDGTDYGKLAEELQLRQQNEERERELARDLDKEPAANDSPSP